MNDHDIGLSCAGVHAITPIVLSDAGDFFGVPEDCKLYGASPGRCGRRAAAAFARVAGEFGLVQLPAEQCPRQFTVS